MIELPLFPLKTVLLPGNTLSLKVFETRYLDMIAECMREDSNFGIILIYKGEETVGDTDIHSIGTTAKISDWQDRADGLLGVTALGLERFEIISTRNQDNGLTVGKVKILTEIAEVDIPEQFYYMLELLNHISVQEGKIPDNNQSFSAMMYRLIYQLPLDTNLKQRLLEIPNCGDRAVILHAELIRLGVIQYVNPAEMQGG
ncbi:MAG: LON peptidase substrate-binding domain-containing protein [Gammaproteobacteria bacterium]